jgi:hypothetical protein
MVETSGHGVRTMGRGCKGEGRRGRPELAGLE